MINIAVNSLILSGKTLVDYSQINHLFAKFYSNVSFQIIKALLREKQSSSMCIVNEKYYIIMSPLTEGGGDILIYPLFSSALALASALACASFLWTRYLLMDESKNSKIWNTDWSHQDLGWVWRWAFREAYKGPLRPLLQKSLWTQ